MSEFVPAAKIEIRLETPRRQIVACGFHQEVRLAAITVRRLERHGVANRVPRRLEVEQRAVLVEEYAFNGSQFFVPV